MEELAVKLEENQETHAPNGWGGRRPNAGRKIGSRDKLKISEFFSPEEIQQLVLEAKLLAFGDGESKPDKDMIKFIMEQLFGKATQKTVNEDADGNALAPILVKFLADNNVTNSN